MVFFHNVMWDLLVRGFAFGLVAGLLVVALFVITQDRGVVITDPPLFLYFLGGVLIGVAFIGGLAFWSFYPLGAWYREKMKSFVQKSLQGQ